MTSALRLLLRMLLRLRLEGTAPSAEAPLLYLARHRARLDSVLLCLFLPGRPLVVLPREDARALWLRLLLRCIPHALIEMSEPAAVKRVLRLLAAGRSVVLYPEGRIVEATSVMKTYDVPSLVAVRSAAPVIPVVVRWRAGWRPGVTIWVARARHITMPGPASGRSARARRAFVSRQLQRALEGAMVDARPRHTLFEALLQAITQHGPRTRIIEDSREQPRSYREVLEGSLAIARWAVRFTRPGENVALLLPNLIPTACTILGLIAFRRVPAMLNYSSGAMAVQAACTAAHTRTVITSRAFIEQARLAPLVNALRHLRIVYLEDVRRDLRRRDKLWLLYARSFPRRATPRGDPLSPAVIIFTSGSEAPPKGVVLSHDAINANVHQIGAVIDFTSRDKVLNALPLYHSYSFSAGLMLCLVTGVKLFLYVSPLRYRAIPEICYRRDVTYLFGTSTFLSYYAKHAAPLDFHSVRYVISGGEKLGEEVARLYLEKFGLRVYEGYGVTECAPVIALSTPQCYRVGTVGRVLPGIDTRLEKVEGIEHGGVLHLKGPNVMLGYLHHDNPGVIDPPRSIFGEGWYATGDVVDVAEDGTVQVVGRVKRFAKIAGEMVSLDAIETAARHASPQHRHAVVLRAQAASGETTVLFTTDPKLTRHALMHAVREMGKQDLVVARQVVWMPELPLLGSGKPDYVTLQTLDLSEAAANEPALRAAEPAPPYTAAREHPSGTASPRKEREG